MQAEAAAKPVGVEVRGRVMVHDAEEAPLKSN